MLFDENTSVDQTKVQNLSNTEIIGTIKHVLRFPCKLLKKYDMIYIIRLYESSNLAIFLPKTKLQTISHRCI